MECPKGSEMKQSSHQVLTLEKAKEWFAGTLNYDLPITIVQNTSAEGRVMIKVYDNNNKLIHQRG